MTLKAVGKQENLYEVVASELREAILNGTLKMGDTLPNETELARQLAVSRPVIREALRYLQAQGLIKINRGTKGGAMVGRIDHLFLLENMADLIRLRQLTVDHLVQVRQFIEPEVFRLAAENATDEDLIDLENILDESYYEVNPDEKRDLTGQFHREVGRACGNPIYAALINRILDFTLAFVSTLKPTHLILHKDEDHRNILETLKKRDPDLAWQLALEHVNQINNQMKALETAWLTMAKEEKAGNG
ncbi:MAG: FadR family transcriptional regulator [Desulfarculus sp.]|nr:FadR family transcriptional regulator [Pseudomonadota bacterium]MBV1716354.1 FadR family transcriptional regulator [Desulfarculus sp.]MBU4573733.1 FadR family transcriptional regulator [Pseudomonadota bacterium]MBU4598503.1 FadR family transcriptional regulator [Pseudomonadota bacterium]MBV1736838.1 FadR family transcriptional regulator [Desulfarculus sp.]